MLHTNYHASNNGGQKYRCNTDEKKDFYTFTLALDALKKSLNGNEKTVILDGDSELAQILTGTD